MDPEEVEFLGEKQLITIIPTFNSPIIHLICGDYGPFKASLPIRVPLWVAVNLKQQQKCRIEQPDWMNIEHLQQIKDNEKLSKTFVKMPNEHYMIIAKLLLNHASDDMIDVDEIRTVIKDIWDIRMSKLRSSVDMLIKNTGSYAAVDHLTLMEINTIRPLLPHALDQLYRMKTAPQRSNESQLQTSSILSHSRSINSFTE